MNRNVKRKYRLKNLLGALSEPKLKLLINPVEIPQPINKEMNKMVSVMVKVPVNVSKKLNKSIFKSLRSRVFVNESKMMPVPMILINVINITAFLRVNFVFSIKRLTGGS